MLELPDAIATASAGARLAAGLRGGDAIALVGELGAGKTTFVIGLVAALGGGNATSPTFGLVHEYPRGRLIVWHADLYRLERAAELRELGLEEIVGDPRGVAIVEWAERFAVMPADHLRIELSHAGDRRVLVATGTGPRGRELADTIDPGELG
ncbi:MAG TPA: tRNA (adenosine(37)-N6)-threonylcarbamoyltransferase complex ATPase subunit type 1 TsaE [Kofleriaceae bacterium]|jgi:tRNA threonylcarbamoyl adenosine modification protein YjeE